jgi:anti-sigma factor RsiW
LPSLPAQHLSDEAVAAFADGALGNGARGRAARHVANCPECAHAVAVQREAVWALRAAPAPALPGGLLDRLRAVPSTTPLSGRPLAVDPNGSAVFPAFGTAAFVEPTRPAEPTAFVRSDVPARAAHSERRVRSYGLLTAAAAVVALGAVGGTVAGTRDAGPSIPAEQSPGAPVRIGPAGDTPADLFFQPAAGTSVFARAGS